VDSSAPSPHRNHTNNARHAPPRRSPSPGHRFSDPEEEAAADDDDDAEGSSDNDNDDGGLEIQVPDARPNSKSTSHLGVGRARVLRSPSNGPISLASATTSVQNSPSSHPRAAAEEIDFGDLGGDDGDEDAEGEEEEDDDDDGGYANGYANANGDRDGDVDVVPMDIGPPARADSKKQSLSAPGAEEDEDDPLFKEMMEGLAGDSSDSEESEEE
jgi:hypothetical protein